MDEKDDVACTNSGHDWNSNKLKLGKSYKCDDCKKRRFDWEEKERMLFVDMKEDEIIDYIRKSNCYAKFPDETCRHFSQKVFMFLIKELKSPFRWYAKFCCREVTEEAIRMQGHNIEYAGDLDVELQMLAVKQNIAAITRIKSIDPSVKEYALDVSKDGGLPPWILDHIENH